jgi:hypothetical protein
MRRLFDSDEARRSPARTVVTCTCLTAATTFLLWRVLFHQPLWLVGIVAGSCSLLVAVAAAHSLRHPEATVNRAVRRTPWFEATLLLGSVATAGIGVLLGEPGLVVVALVFALLALTLHRARRLLRHRLTR